MSAKVSWVVPPRGAGCNPQRSKTPIDLNVPQVDLNVPPPDHSSDVGTSGRAPALPEGRMGQRASPLPPLIIDADSIDDDVVLSSPRAFAEAKNNSRIRNRSNVVDVDLVSESYPAANNRNKRPRIPANQPIINCESYVITEKDGPGLDGIGMNMAAQTILAMAAPPPPLPPPPPEPVFTCPVCMGPLVEEMTTKCGHIFCKACIKKSISVQSKCPTCRKKMTMKDTVRIYLPNTS